MGEELCDLGWWVIHGDALMDALKRAHDGEDPTLVYAELYANTYSASDGDED